MMTRFAFDTAGPFARAMAALAAGPAYVDLTPDRLRIRLGVLFRADVPRVAVAAAERNHDPVTGWGAHGWGGRWLVNTSSRNLVRLAIEPRQRARVLGVPVPLSGLRMSLADPDGFLAELGR